MSASLVGSEMCIRDRHQQQQQQQQQQRPQTASWRKIGGGPNFIGVVPVSYTHLTLPTICSV
eukprot:12328027-Alexandrium_andersonii.AAC.1